MTEPQFHLQALAAEAARLPHHSADDRDEEARQWPTVGPLRSWVPDAAGTSEWRKPAVEAEERTAAQWSPSMTGPMSAGNSSDTDSVAGLRLLAHRSWHSEKTHIKQHRPAR